MSVEVVIEGRERADHTNHDGHGMGVPAEAGVEPGHLLMHHGVAGDQIAEGVVLLLRRQLAVQEQIAGLHEGAMLGKLIDGIAAIEQHALSAIDEGDFRFTARRRGKARIVSEVASLGIKRGDVDHVRTERALAHRQLMVSSGHQRRLRCHGFANIAF